jgi:hypothetical protein
MNELVPIQRIVNKILVIRDQKVMLDRDLAELYGVPTKVLNQAVSRNMDRFPPDFMFTLSNEEFDILRSQIVTASWGMVRYPPRAFTEQGVAMLSSVLRSKRAVQVNILIMRAFVKMREMLQSHAELKRKIDAMEKKYDSQFRVVFEAIKQLMEPPATPKKVYGFRAAKNGNGSTKTKARKRT